MFFINKYLIVRFLSIQNNLLTIYFTAIKYVDKTFTYEEIEENRCVRRDSQLLFSDMSDVIIEMKWYK